MTKTAEFRGKSQSELKEILDSLLREQLKLKFVKSSGELTEVSKVKKVRRNIARVLTLLGDNA
jgi:large subunit ribosomal protein L29